MERQIMEIEEKGSRKYRSTIGEELEAAPLATSVVLMQQVWGL